MSTRVITPTAVLSYPHLDKAQPGPNGGEPKFSATFVFDAAAQKTPLFLAMQAAAIEAATTKFGPTITVPGGKKVTIEQAFSIKALKSPFRTDGEAKGYGEGSVFINTRTADQPQMLRGDKSEITPADAREVLYPGSKVRASVTAFGYDSSGNKGVSFALNNIQKVGEGDRLDSRKAAVDEFDALDATPADLESLGIA